MNTPSLSCPDCCTDLSLFEPVEVACVAGIVAGIIAGALKQGNA